MPGPEVKIYLVTSPEVAVGKSDLIVRMDADYRLFAERQPFRTLSKVAAFVENRIGNSGHPVTIAVEAANAVQGDYLEPMLRALSTEFPEGRVSFRKITIEV